MTAFYCKSGGGAADYNAAHAYSNGDKVVPAISDAGTNFAVARKWVWEVTTAGTTNAVASWPASVTQDVTTMTINGCVFTARKPGFSSGSTANWAYATIYLLYANTCGASGDTVYVSNNHAETQTSAYNCSPVAGTNVICVDDAAAPPTAEASTATITTTGNTSVTCSANAYSKGLIFVVGSGASGTALMTCAGVFENCSFRCATTGTISSGVAVSSAGGEWINCTVKFGATAQTIGGTFKWRGGSLLAGGTTPASLIGTAGLGTVIEDVDLSNAANTMNLFSNGNAMQGGTVRNVTMPTSWSGALNLATPGSIPAMCVFDMQNVDSTGTNYRMARINQYGSIVSETTIVRTSGASDGVTPLSWKLVCTSSAGLFPQKFVQTPEIVQWNSTVTGNITVTVEAVSSASVNDDELWLEVNYLSASGAPLGTLITSAKANVLAAGQAVPTSTAPWTSSPATPVYQKMSVILAPRLAGFIHATVKLCKASKTVYVDPKLTVT